MIKSIELVNWKTHKRTRMEFQNGVNVLIGIMGAGKSSVLDAMSFALFGTFPALKSRRVSTTDLISNRPVQEDEASVTLIFDSDGSTYSVTRKLSMRGSSTAKLERDGEYLQAQAERVNEEIERVLKIDYDTFSRAIYAEQNNLDYFLELTKSDRKKQIDNMLGLDQFASAEENATSLINSIKGMIKDEEATLMQIDIKSYKTHLERLADEKKSIEKEQESLRAAERSAEVEAALISKKLDDAKALYAKKLALSTEIASINGRITAMNEELDRIGKLNINEDKLQKELDEKRALKGRVDGEITQLRAKLKEATAKLASLETSSKSNEMKARERERIIDGIKGRSLEALERELKQNEDSLKEMNDGLARNNAQKKELTAWLTELKKHVGRCPVCESELDEEKRKKLLGDKSALIDGIDRENARLTKQITEMEALVKRLGSDRTMLAIYMSKLKDYENLDATIKRENEALATVKPQVKELESEVEAKGMERDAAAESISKLNANFDVAKRKKSYTEQVARDSAAVKGKTLEIDAIAVDDKQVDELQEMLRKRSGELGDAKAKIASNLKYMANINSQIDEKARQVKNFALIEERIGKRRDYINNLNKFKTALMETGELLRNRLVSSINSLMDGLWPDLYPYADYRGVRLATKKDDYLLEADIGGAGGESWVSVDSIASGGERSVACLVMRVAMSMVIVPNLKWIILDEPTHNLDSNGISKLISVLGESLPKVVEQIFIITHDDSLKQIGSARIYTLDRDKSANGPTAISEL
jgi:exonuclease SbcC